MDTKTVKGAEAMKKRADANMAKALASAKAARAKFGIDSNSAAQTPATPKRPSKASAVNIDKGMHHVSEAAGSISHIAYAFGYIQSWIAIYAKSHGLSESFITNELGKLLSAVENR